MARLAKAAQSFPHRRLRRHVVRRSSTPSSPAQLHLARAPRTSKKPHPARPDTLLDPRCVHRRMRNPRQPVRPSARCRDLVARRPTPRPLLGSRRPPLRRKAGHADVTSPTSSETSIHQAAREATNFPANSPCTTACCPRQSAIFAINELPISPAKSSWPVQHHQEGDVQIKGYPIRLPLDVASYSARTQDYTAAQIITPLRTASGPKSARTIRNGRRGIAITAQELDSTSARNCAFRNM